MRRLLVWPLLLLALTLAVGVAADDVRPDDCSACCSPSASASGLRLACCENPRPDGLYNTPNGECSGLPCCSYRGRRAQNRPAWYPCLLFPTCSGDQAKQEFCQGAASWSFMGGATFRCTDACCAGPVLESNRWVGVARAMPGQRDAAFALELKPADFVPAFYPAPGDGARYALRQIVLALPADYDVDDAGGNVTCAIQADAADLTGATTTTTATRCAVARFDPDEMRPHLVVDIPRAFQQQSQPFRVVFDRVITPTGMPDAAAAPQLFSTDSNLVPMYFSFNDTGGNVFATFYHTSELERASLSSGAFVPENIYPGNTGNASLSFFTNARVPRGASIELSFGAKWRFPSDATWAWEALAQGLDGASLATGSADSGGGGSSSDAMRPQLVNFSSQSFNASANKWTLQVEQQDLAIGWVRLAVDRVQNPSVAYSGLNLASIVIRDARQRLIVEGTFSAISVEVMAQPIVSPYNYVTMVVLIGSLLFCTIVIRSNGLTFSLLSIWTDLTAICTVLALVTAIVNNLVWVLTRSGVYFYISRVFLCFTFTMLTAVCFHWGTVLNLKLRQIPKVKTVIAFVVLNLLFYAFQAAMLLSHRDLIERVYTSENDSQSYANQQCKGAEDDDATNSVFSDIQGFLWRCYAENDEQFFLISATVTSLVFLALTLLVMALGVLVMRRGKLVVGHLTGSQQVALVRALRLYYALIGVVTLVYLLSWVIQLASRSSQAISYPWFYIFTVWLPYSIPPCCLIFLQWNATAKTLKDADHDPSSPMSQCAYDEIRTPSFAFSSTKWSDGVSDDSDDGEYTLDGDDVADVSIGGNVDDLIGLSMALEINDRFPRGCFIGIQRLCLDPVSQALLWQQVSTTDTVELQASASAASDAERHVYSFLAVPRIPISSIDDKVRLVVYAVSSATTDGENRHDHREMTAADVLAALDSRSSFGVDDDLDSHYTVSSELGDDELLDGTTRSRIIDELFEEESVADSTDALTSVLPSISIVAEFTVSTDALVSAGARGERLVLVAAEDSYKQMGLRSTPPQLSVHTVLPKAARAKYGIGGIAIGLTPSHTISRQYHIQENDLVVVEDLTESRFSNRIPRQILEVIIRARAKQLMVAQNDLARLDAFDRQRQKGSDRGIYENLIQQIQDDGDISRCRDWMIRRCANMSAYVDELRRLRRLYLARDRKKEYFKASTEKKNQDLRFLPINLHIQEMWVGSSKDSDAADEGCGNNVVYDTVTVGAMAAHVYKFKNGGILGLEQQRMKIKARRREPVALSASYNASSPLWTEEEQKGDTMDWELQRRMDVCFPQAVAALVTAFTRKVDLALQHSEPRVGSHMLEQIARLGFLFNVESLVSTHGNEAGMLEDMAGALNELRNVRFVLVDETEQAPTRDIALSFDVDEETKQNHDAETPSPGSALSGVVDVNVFTSVESAREALGADASGLLLASDAASSAPGSPTNSIETSSSSFSNVGHRLIHHLMRAKSSTFLGSHRSRPTASSLDHLFEYTHLVVGIKVRSSAVKLPETLARGGTIAVVPVLFSQGINEKQTLANNTGSSVTRLQDVINEESLRTLRAYCDRYCNFMDRVRARQQNAAKCTAISRDRVERMLVELERLLDMAQQTRKKRPEILQVSSDLCRRVGGGRVTVCKSAKDRTGMSVTLEQGRLLVQHHGLPEAKKADLVAAMRSQGVRLENAFKNTGRRVFAFNALQRSLLPEEYRCPAQTAGKNVS
ncbi:hypothetical protein P43SY_003660 [Pythium insidiosum]|uniref:Inositol-3,4-bisphosphate 4-phosphatase n=1 Tax=Pythium insidiosum TaxID=114742 RepID=A0AAD5LXT8_PYTIN|nr:hypothetical protein P43SY_003660 [Pythium insidiosum]